MQKHHRYSEIAREENGLDGPLFSCTAGTIKGRRFFVYAHIRYKRRDDVFFPFSLHLLLRHEQSLFRPMSIDYIHTKDGKPWLNWGMIESDYTHPVSQLAHWLADLRLWQHTG